MSDREMAEERCRCGHSRGEHADRDNPLQVVPLAMTEADDEGAANRLPVLVRGGGACTVAGCGCGAFQDAPA